MKKRLLIFLFLPCLAFGQATDQTTADHLLFATAGIQGYNCYEPNLVVGLGYTHSLGDHWNLNYRVDVGRYYFHIPMGLPLGIVVYLITAAKGKEGFPDIIRLASMIPEGAGYSFNLTPRLALTPYLNVLSLDYMKRTHCTGPTNGRDNQELFAMIAAGGCLSLKLGQNLMLSGFTEYRGSWGGQVYGWQSGLRLGHTVNF